MRGQRASICGSALALGLVACAAVSAASCTEKSDQPSDDGARSLLADESEIFELATNSCALFDRCFGPLRASFGTVTTQLSDVDVRASRCDELADGPFEHGMFAALADSVEDGRVIYHPDRLEACLEADAARECHEISTTLPACAEAFEGTAKVGEPCASAYDCGEDAFCDVGLTPDSTCPSVCKQRQPAGSPCVHPAECESGMRCYDPAFTPGVQPQLRCLPPAKAGESCHGMHCGPGLTCVAASATDRTCQQLDRDRQLGEPCTPSSQCEGGAACRIGAGATERTCALSSEGAPCQLGSECGANEFCACVDPACNERRCARWPSHDEACGRAKTNSQVCALGAFCDGTTCRDRLPNGEPCTTNLVCLSFQCTDGICTVPGACE